MLLLYFLHCLLFHCIIQFFRNCHIFLFCMGHLKLSMLLLFCGICIRRFELGMMLLLMGGNEGIGYDMLLLCLLVLLNEVILRFRNSQELWLNFFFFIFFFEVIFFLMRDFILFFFYEIGDCLKKYINYYSCFISFDVFKFREFNLFIINSNSYICLIY